MKEKSIPDRSYSLCGNMFVSFIITFAAGTLCYEAYVPENIIKIYRMLIFVICLFTWIALSVISGVQNKWQYEIFTVLFWLIPPVTIFLANDGPEICRMSITMYVFSELFAIMFTAPAEAVGEILNLGVTPVIILVVLICTFAFLTGRLFSANLKKVITLF